MAKFFSQVKEELIYSFKPPFWWLSTLFFNFVLAIVAIILTDYTHHHYFRAGLIGLIMSTWLLADVTATNQLGADPIRYKLMREKGFSAIQILNIRNTMLTGIIIPVSIIFAVIGDIIDHNHKLLLVDILVAIVPVGPWIGFGNLISATLPYRQILVKERIKNRLTIIPWLSKMALPYVASTFTIPFCLWPLYATNLYGHNKLSYHFLLDFILVFSWSLFVFALGTYLSHEYLRHRENKIDSLQY
jgi:hypothetical protein